MIKKKNHTAHVPTVFYIHIVHTAVFPIITMTHIRISILFPKMYCEIIDDNYYHNTPSIKNKIIETNYP